MFREIVERLSLEAPPAGDGPTMEFRLVVRGYVPPSKRGTVDTKHRIRRELHPQLRCLWAQHPRLADWLNRQRKQGKDGLAMLAQEYGRYGFNFVPLVTEQAAASISILMLRRDEPHKVMTGTGDIDARLKTLLDAFQLPQQRSEIGDNVPAEDEDPFFVLLQDDKLIYELNVTTDRLLVPVEDGEDARDIHAIIQVKTKSFVTETLTVWDFP